MAFSRAWMCVLGMALVVGPALAQRAAVPAGGTTSTERCLIGLPADYESVLIVNNAARQRQSGAGRALAALLDEAGAFPETMRAWRELAAVMDWSGDQAFDELLGRRVCLVVRGLDGPGDPQWAVVTEVSMETERLLRQRLKAAPRGDLAGLGVLAVEDGKYELAVGRAQPTDVDYALTGAQPPTAAILLGPGGDNPLMAELAPSILSRSGLATPARAWRAGQKDRDCDLAFLFRRAAPAERSASRFLLLTATLEESGWDAKLACSPDMVWGQPAALGQVRPWSDSAFRQIERDAMFASMGVIGSVRWMPAIPRLASLGALMPAVEAGACGQLAAVVVRPAREAKPERHELHPAPSPAREPALASGTEQSRRDLAPAREDTTHPRLAVTVGVETNDGCRMVNQGDQAVARMVALLSGVNPDSPALSPRMQFEVDVPEGATRTLALEDVPLDESHAAEITRMFGNSPIVSWGNARAVVPQASASLASDRRRSWWIASLAPAGQGWAERDTVALSGPESASPTRRLSIGVVRPAAMLGWLSDAEPGLAWARWIESLHWDVWLGAEGSVQGTVRLKLARTGR